ALRAQDLHAGHDLADQLVRPVGRRAGQGARQPHHSRAGGARRPEAGPRQLDEHAHPSLSRASLEDGGPRHGPPYPPRRLGPSRQNRDGPRNSRLIPLMLFLVALVVDGALAGAIYALIALGFVVVYKASRVLNFALGEWLMLGALLVAAGVHRLALA